MGEGWEKENKTNSYDIVIMSLGSGVLDSDISSSILKAFEILNRFLNISEPRFCLL